MVLLVFFVQLHPNFHLSSWCLISITKKSAFVLRTSKFNVGSFAFLSLMILKKNNNCYQRNLKHIVEMSNHNEDVTACETKLGKQPPIFDDKKSIIISGNIADRLQTGSVDDERVKNYESYWIDKLACIDESHTVRNNIDIIEAEEILKRLTNYVQSDKPKLTFEAANSLKNCFATSHGKTLQCSEDVQQFIQQVDRSMYYAVRKGDEGIVSGKKISYAERFKRGYSS